MLQAFDDVRVVTNSARFVRRNAAVSLDGLLLRHADSGISSLTVPEERLVPWAEIQSIQVRRGAGGMAPVAGGAIGFAIGISIYMAQIPEAIFSFGEQQPNPAPILVGLIGGALLGALIDRPGPWRAVYP